MKDQVNYTPYLATYSYAFLSNILSGEALGNLYYTSWGSFLLTLGIGKACYEDYVEAQIIMEQQRHSSNRPSLRTVEMRGPQLASVDEGVEDVDI